MLSAINLKSLRNDDYIQFMNGTLQIVDLNNATTLQVQVQRDLLGQQVQGIEDIFVTDQGSPLTVAIVAADLRRDNAINGIIALAGAYTYHFDAAKKAHGDALTHNFGLYGPGIGTQNLNAETATINNLLADWTNQPTLAAAITALGLTDWKAELATANAAFNDLYIQRTQEMATAPGTNIETLRLSCNDAYYSLRNFIDSYFTINAGADPWGKTTSEINALVAQYNTLLAQRAADAAKEAAKKKAAKESEAAAPKA